VNQKRNEHVHPKKSKPHSKEDALEMIKKITRILLNGFQAKVKPKGTVALPQDFKVVFNKKTEKQKRPN